MKKLKNYDFNIIISPAFISLNNNALFLVHNNYQNSDNHIKNQYFSEVKNINT